MDKPKCKVHLKKELNFDFDVKLKFPSFCDEDLNSCL